MSRPESAVAVTYEIVSGLLQDGLACRYSNMLLSNTNPDITDVYDEGPLALYTIDNLALYWPGGHPVYGHDFEMVGKEPAPPKNRMELRSELRAAILGASIGEAALSRIQPEIKAAWREFEQLVTPRPPVDVALESCRHADMPLAVCSFGRVLRSRRSPVGKQVMSLWYPTSVRPEPVLEKLQEVVRADGSTS